MFMIILKVIVNKMPKKGEYVRWKKVNTVVM